MAMIMRALNRARRARSSDLGARPTQRALFCEYVARTEFGRAGEGEVFLHRGFAGRGGEPRLVQTTARVGNPRRYAIDPVLLGKVFGHRANQRVQPWIIRPRGLSLDARVFCIRVRREQETVDELGQRNILRLSRADALNRLGEGIWAHRGLRPGSCTLAEISAFRQPSRYSGRSA